LVRGLDERSGGYYISYPAYSSKSIPRRVPVTPLFSALVPVLNAACLLISASPISRIRIRIRLWLVSAPAARCRSTLNYVLLRSATPHPADVPAALRVNVCNLLMDVCSLHLVCCAHLHHCAPVADSCSCTTAARCIIGFLLFTWQTVRCRTHSASPATRFPCLHGAGACSRAVWTRRWVAAPGGMATFLRTLPPRSPCAGAILCCKARTLLLTFWWKTYAGWVQTPPNSPAWFFAFFGAGPG